MIFGPCLGCSAHSNFSLGYFYIFKCKNKNKNCLNTISYFCYGDMQKKNQAIFAILAFLSQKKLNGTVLKNARGTELFYGDTKDYMEHIGEGKSLP